MRNDQRCPFCRSCLEEAKRAHECPQCKTASHIDCWRMQGGCSVYGCASRDAFALPLGWWLSAKDLLIAAPVGLAILRLFAAESLSSGNIALIFFLAVLAVVGVIRKS